MDSKYLNSSVVQTQTSLGFAVWTATKCTQSHKTTSTCGFKIKMWCLEIQFVEIWIVFINISLDGDHLTHLFVSASSSCRCSSVQGLKSKWVFVEDESCGSPGTTPSPSLGNAEEGSPPNSTARKRQSVRKWKAFKIRAE